MQVISKTKKPFRESARRTPGGQDAPPRVTPRLAAPDDGLILLGIGFFALGVRILPERHWRRAAGAVARLARPLRHMMHGGGGGETVAAKAGGRALSVSPADLPERLFARHIERNLDLAHVRRRGGRTALEGREHLEAALAAGRGAILWDGHFAFASLRTKMALAGAGYAVHHLSRPDHGYSGTRFGMAVLNPFATRPERAYLAERVVMNLEAPAIALRRLANVLADNGIASFTVRGHADNPITAPLFGGTIALGPGAPALAHRTGAALLPVFTVQDGDGSFVTTVGAPIEIDRTVSRDEALTRAGADYVRRLEPVAAAHADQWLGWLD